MAVASGNCRTLNEFMEELITLATANGWTLLRGAASLGDSGEFPISTRYLRIACSNPQEASAIRLSGLNIRETAGGSNLSLSSAQLTASGYTSGNPSENVLDGLGTTWWDGTPTSLAYLYYDFGSPQVIRQIGLRAPSPSAVNAPRTLAFARSDDGINWDTFYIAPAVTLWTGGETKLFTFPLDGTSTVSSTLSGGVRRPVEFWLQGPGYDADRRVNLGFKTDYDLVSNSGRLLLNAATSYDSTKAWVDMEKAVPICPALVVDASTEDLDYWLYVNSTRIIGVVKSSAADYASFYAGFLAAFGEPDQYPFPLYLAGSSTESAPLAYNATNPANGCFWDPGSASGKVLDQLGVWQDVGNQQSSTGQVLDPLGTAPYHVSPWHHGAATSLGMFGSLSGDTDGGTGHFLSSIQPTLQDDLPVIDAVVMGPAYGALGALQGVVCIPGGGILAAEAIIDIGGDDYRTFPNRTRRLGNSWAAIQEI